MKKTYELPEMKVQKFRGEIVTASGEFAAYDGAVKDITGVDNLFTVKLSDIKLSDILIY